MLNRLTRKFRWRAAVAIAVLYGLCSVAPALALAFAEARAAVHCLTGDHHGAGKSHGHVHDHGNGVVHSHADEGAAPAGKVDNDKGDSATCCGVFCITAIPASLHFAIGRKLGAKRQSPREP